MTDLPSGAAELLRGAGFPLPAGSTRLEGGRNNRVFSLAFDGRGPIVLKQYFHDAADTRDRLAAEYAFLELAAARGVGCVARPLACSADHKLALYSLLPGRHVTAADVSADAIEQALAFVVALNGDWRAKLPVASEACFSEAEHLATVDRRIVRLTHAVEEQGEDACARFLHQQLQPAWVRIKAAAHRQLDGLSEALSARLISPSDFGFHNALVADGRISFVDFEYAGWDTAGKLVGDAFNQVKVPLPMTAYARFRDRIAALFDLQRGDIARVCDALLPVYGVKWVTILLNEFLPVGAKRRDFAAYDVKDAARALQLEAARAKLADIENRSLVA